jgi:hypothetical protein
MEYVFAIVALLNLTGSFRLLGPVLGDVGLVSRILLGFQIVYILYHFRLVKKLLLEKLPFVWLVLIVAWPIATSLYSPSPSLRLMGLQVYYFSLVLGGTIYVSHNGWSAFQRILIASVAITCMGLFWSLMNPGFFIYLTEHMTTGSIEAYKDRPCGFFLTPNRTVLAIALLFSVSLARYRTWDDSTLLAYLALMMLMSALTTSRGGMLGTFLCGSVAYGLHQRWGRDRMDANLLAARLAKGLLVGLAIPVVFVLFLPVLNEAIEYLFSTNLNQKMTYWYDTRSSRRVLADESVSSRLKAQKEYVGFLLRESPLFGFGLGSEFYYRELGILKKSAHNAFLRIGVKYGLLYLVAVAAALGYSFVQKPSRYLHEIFQINVFMVVLSFIVIFSFTSGIVFFFRPLYLVFGGLLALALYPGIVPADRQGLFS